MEIEQLMLFIAGLVILGGVFPAAWPVKPLLVMWMKCCGQRTTVVVVLYVVYVVLFRNGMYTVYIVFVGIIK